MRDFHRRTVAAVFLAATVLATAPARAATIGTIQGKGGNDFINMFLGPGSAIEGWFGASLFLTGLSSVTVQDFGAEAGFTNSFAYGGCGLTHQGGGTFVNRGPASLGATDALSNCTTSAQPAGVVNFSFLINGLTGPGNGSGAANPATGRPNFFVAFDNNYVFDTAVNRSSASSGQSILLFFDDAGGGTEADHDDMIIRLIAQGGTFQVPEPTSLLFLGVGLLGIAALGRRVKE